MKIKISQNKLGLLIQLIIMFSIYFMPSFFLMTSSAQQTQKLLQMMYSSFVVFHAVFTSNGKVRKKVDTKFFLLICIYEVILVVSTILNKGTTGALLGDVFVLLGLVISLSNCLKKDYRYTFTLFTVYIAVLMIINTGLLFLYPNGLRVTPEGYRFNFLGIDNNMTQYSLVLIMCAYIIKYNFKELKVFCNLLMILSVSQLLYLQVGTGIIGIAVLLLLVFMDKYLHLHKSIIRPQTMIMVIVALLLVVVIIRENNFIMEWISDALNKDITLTGRTTIWMILLGYVSQAPWLGYGMQEVPIVRAITEVERSYSPAAHAHNQLIQILIESGIVSLIVIIVLLGEVFTKYRRNWNRFAVRVACYTLISFLVVSIGEVIFSHFFWAFFVLGFYIVFYDNNGKDVPSVGGK